VAAEPDTLDWTYYGSVEWTLTEDEMANAAEHAQKVVAHARDRGMNNKFTPRGESMEAVHARGFAAELAASHATGLEAHWRLLPPGYRRQDKAPDIGTKVEVRSAKFASGRLVARPGDPIDWYYLLVSGLGPRCMVWGWLSGYELMVPHRWEEDDPPPAWFAKQADLKPLPLPPDA
jgi:hypothetical protein